jgi:hypothetical protein
VMDGWIQQDRRAARPCPQGQAYLRFGHRRLESAPSAS